MVGENPSSITLTVPTFYITVNGSKGTLNVADFSTITVEAYGFAGANVVFGENDTNSFTNSSTIGSTTLDSSGYGKLTFTVKNTSAKTKTIYIMASTSSSANANITSNIVEVVIAADTIDAIQWLVYIKNASEVLQSGDQVVAGCTWSTNSEYQKCSLVGTSYNTDDPNGGSIGVRANCWDSKGNQISDAAVIVDFGFKTVNATTDSSGFFDTGTEQIPANNGGSPVNYTLTVKPA